MSEPFWESLFRPAVIGAVSRAEALRAGWAEAVSATRASAAGSRGTGGAAVTFLPDAANTPSAPGLATLHIDGAGRPLLLERDDDGYVEVMWTHREEVTEEVIYYGGEPHVWWILHPNGAPAVGAVKADLYDREVQRWTWFDGKVVRADRASAAPLGWLLVYAVEVDYHGGGWVVAERRAALPSDDDEATRLPDDDSWLDAIEQGLVLARGLPTPLVPEPPIPQKNRNVVVPELDPGLANESLTDRAALERLFSSVGLDAHSRRLAQEVATVGLLLHRGGPQSSSRIGGRSPVPAPHGPSGPLTFLAAIDLSELPDPWPHDGWWLFFADPDTVEPEPNHEGCAARLLHLPACTPPSDGHSVTFTPKLTLPDGYDAWRDLGLTPDEAPLYDAISQTRQQHEGTWIGGCATGAQGHSSEDDTVLLLHLEDNDRTLQFRIPSDALERGDYAAVVTEIEF